MYIVKRVNNDKIMETKEYKFVVFNSDNRGKELVENPEIGSALILPPFNSFYSWLTSPITEIVNEHHFFTKNSEYKITKIE